LLPAALLGALGSPTLARCVRYRGRGGRFSVAGHMQLVELFREGPCSVNGPRLGAMLPWPSHTDPIRSHP
jgi:hypothetical protein